MITPFDIIVNQIQIHSQKIQILVNIESHSHRSFMSLSNVFETFNDKFGAFLQVLQ